MYAYLLQEAILYSEVFLGSLKSQCGNIVDTSPPGWVQSIQIWLCHPSLLRTFQWLLLPLGSSPCSFTWPSRRLHRPFSSLISHHSMPHTLFAAVQLCCLGQVQEIQSCCYCLVAESCPTLCNPMDCCPPGFSVHGILQGRILDQIAISFSRRSSWPRYWTYVSCIGRLILYPEPPGKPEIQSNGC